MALIALLILFAGFAAALGVFALGCIYALVWLVAFTSPLGHRVQMERLGGRARLRTQGASRAERDDYDAETRRMTEAAILARRSRRRW